MILKPSSKKGQVVAFIIVGIVILVLFAIVLLLSKSTIKVENNIIPEKKEGVKHFVQGCLNKAVIDSAFLASKQGGKLNPDIFVATENLAVPIYWYEGSDFTPTKEEFEDTLSLMIADEVENCLIKLKHKFDYGKARVGVTLSGSINVDLIISIKIDDLGSTTKIEKFSSDLQLNLIEELDKARTIMDEILVNGFNIESIRDEGIVNYIQLDQDTKLVYIYDVEKSLKFERPYYYYFAVNKAVNVAPELYISEEINFYFNQYNKLYFKALDLNFDELSYSVDNPMIEISKDESGYFLHWTPKARGVFDFRVAVSDGILEDYEVIKVVVT